MEKDNEIYNQSKRNTNHKNSIYNRIENLKKRKNLNYQALLEEKETPITTRPGLRVSVFEKLKNINDNLNNCKIKFLYKKLKYILLYSILLDYIILLFNINI